MISRLQGLVIDHELDGACVVDVHGVGYEVFVPQRSSARLPVPPEQVSLFIHSHVREDAFMLFGFLDADDRLAFRALLGISSIGPKLALAILGQLSAGELALAVARSDKDVFKGISGVGKKTVERLVLELKDKLPASLISGAPAMRATSAPAFVQTPQRERVADALVQLGYRRGEAEAAVAKLPEDALDQPVEAALRLALSFLG